MTSVYFFQLLIGLNFIQFTWFNVKLKNIDIIPASIYSILVVISMFISSQLEIKQTIIFYIVIFPLLFLIILLKTNNWLKTTIIVALFNTFVMFSCLPTINLWDMLHLKHFISNVTYHNYGYLSLLFQQILFILLLVFSYILNNYFQFNFYLAKFRKKYIFLSFTILIFVFYHRINEQIGLRENFSNLFYISTVAAILNSLLLFLFLYYLTKFYETQQYIQTLTTIFNKEKENFDILNEFKHDYKNILSSLTYYLENNQVEQAIELIHKINDYSYKQIDEELYLMISQIDIPTIQGLLIKYINKCEEFNVDFKINIMTDLKKITIELIDLIRCLSILLDNALEATIETDKPTIELTIYNNEQLTIITITNTYSTVDVKTKNLLKRNYSTKNNHSGIGLHIFNKILKQYPKVNFEMKKNKQEFSVIITC